MPSATRSAWVNKALEGLAAADRQILELRYIQGLSFAEIA